MSQVHQSIAGKRFGRLLAVERAPNHGNVVMYRCQCDCGVEKIVSGSAMRRGFTKSCGCLHRENSHSFKHGCARRGDRIPGYSSWATMKTRCTNPAVREFEHYGGRGITYCSRWDLFENFLADMGERPAGMTLDRIDVNGNYEPSNCRWATQKEQTNNTRRNVRISLGGETLTINQWAERTGITRHTLSWRLKKGWPAEKILTQKARAV